jgi:uncharacterized zinc-type alcohol dehydrogenase-like protein
MIKAMAAQEAGAPLTEFQYDAGELANDQVEIDVKYCGICHSDLSMIDNEWGISQYPLVPGHEVAGVISQVGSNVSKLKVGQKVGLGWHSGYCNHCSQCDSGDHNLCAESQGTIISHHGGFADKVRADANSVVAIPDEIPLEVAGPLFCGGITVFNPLVQYAVKPTDKVAVIGIGGLGHLALQFLNAWGCEVTAFTSSNAKRKEALELGAHHTLNSKDPEELKASAGKFDMIISTVNVALDWNLYLQTLAVRGRLHFVGATLEPLNIGVFNLMAHQCSVSSSPVGSPTTIETMLDFSARHHVQPKIELFPFANVNDALDRLRSGKAHYRIVLKM